MNWFRFGAGRDFYRARGLQMWFGFWPRPECPEGEIPWRLSGYVSWDWVPPRIYWLVAPAADVPGSSAAWTGRTVAFRGFDWSRWYRPHWGFTYIRD